MCTLGAVKPQGCNLQGFYYKTAIGTESLSPGQIKPYCALSNWSITKSMGYFKKDVTPLLTHWSYVFLALTQSKCIKKETCRYCKNYGKLSGAERWHDDVIKWKHFPRNWPFVRGIHRSPLNSPHKGKWRGALMFSLICPRINGWVNNGDEAGDLRRHRAHYDVIVMNVCICEPLRPWLR